MNRYEAGFARVHATPAFQKRLLDRLNEELRSPAPIKPVPVMTRKRKALLILIAAVLLLLSACAAYAVYWSSAQQAKEYAQSDQAVDDRLAKAQQYADAAIAGLTFFSPLSGTAEVDGITFEPVGVCYYPNESPPEVHITFNSADSKTGDSSRLYDFDFVLTIGQNEYPAYAKADGTVRALPAIAMADSSGLGADLEMWFRIDDQAIVSGTPMNLSGTLYQWDDSGQRGENLGSFSFDFVYEIPKEEIEAERARLVEKIYAGLNADAEALSAALAELPNKMTELNIKQDDYTFTDAQATKDGFLLGQTRVTYGADATVFYMDGYRIETEPISDIYTPDKSRIRQDVAWEVAYYGTYETVTCYPWYAPIEELPETVLIAVLRDAGTEQRTRSDVNGYYEGEKITYTWNAVELLLRVNPHTGEITLPKDDAERKAWREETFRLAEDGRNVDYLASLSGSQTSNGVTMSLLHVRVCPNRGTLDLECEVDGMYDPRQLAYCLMHLTINGVEQDTSDTEARISQYTFSEESANVWVKSYGGWQIHNNWVEGQEFGLRVPRSTWKNDFTIRLQMDVYDRDENWNLVFIGSFDLSATVNKDDIQSGTTEEILAIRERQAIAVMEGKED